MKNNLFESANLAVEKFGDGSETLLLFHGYGQDISAFDEVLPGIPGEFTRYHFHLPAHGESLQAVKHPFSKKSLKAYFLRWFEENGVRRFSLAGYSLGGKLALLLAEFFPDRIHKLILIAPDGVKPNYAEMLFNRNLIGRVAIQVFHKNPIIIKGSLHLARKSGLMHEKVFRYFVEQTAQAANREFALSTWKAFRKLRPKLNKVINGLQREKSTRIMLIYGRSDKLVPSSYMRRFAARLRSPVIKEFPGGHQLLTSELIPLFYAFLKDSQNEKNQNSIVI